MSKDPLTLDPFDKLTTPLSLVGEREIKERGFHRERKLKEWGLSQAPRL